MWSHKLVSPIDYVVTQSPKSQTMTSRHVPYRCDQVQKNTSILASRLQLWYTFYGWTRGKMHCTHGGGDSSTVWIKLKNLARLTASADNGIQLDGAGPANARFWTRCQSLVKNWSDNIYTSKFSEWLFETEGVLLKTWPLSWYPSP